MEIGLSLSLTSNKGVGGGYHYYYDPEGGSDSNSGLTPAAPKLTWGAISTLVGSQTYRRIGIKAGTVSREECAIGTVGSPINGTTVGKYGVGDIPMFDAGQPLVNASFTPTVGQPNVYEIPVTFTGTTGTIITTEYRNAYESDRALIKMNSLAGCNGLAGSCYWSAEGAGVTSATLYVHPLAGGDPTTNGLSYAYTKRYIALYMFGDNCVANGVRTRRQRNNNGSLVIEGRSGRFTACVIEDGHKHAAYMGAGGLVDGCTFKNGYWGAGGSAPQTGANHMVFFDPGAVGIAGITWQNSTFVVDTALTNQSLTGVFCHTGTGDNFASAVGLNNSYTNLGVGSNLTNVINQSFQTNIYTNTGICDQTGYAGAQIAWTGNQITVTSLPSAQTPGPNPSGTGQTITMRGNSINSGTYNAILMTGTNLTVVMEDNTFIQGDTSSRFPLGIFRCNGAGLNFTSNRNVFQKTYSQDNFYNIPATATYTGDYNQFVGASPKWTKDSGSTFITSLANWRTATGQDAHST